MKLAFGAHDGEQEAARLRERLLAVLRGMTPRTAGVYAVWVSSVLASMSALYELAKTYGGWGPWAALLFPVPLDIYWIIALNTAIDSSLPGAARAKAAAHAGVALMVSVGGNILYHELHARDIVLGSWSALTVGVISSVPLVIAAALTHLALLGRPAAAPAAKARPRQAATLRQSATVSVSRATAVPDRATAGTVAVSPAPEAAVPSGDLPRALKAGAKPDPVAVQAARDEWHTAMSGGRIHSPRSLEQSVNERFGYKVIGRTSAGTVIAEERDRRRSA